ncbi:MAG: ABC transporter permease, partial [Pirellulales bacterium]|nr:ABC transporter permease [Pirellulales bacterium]
MVIDQEILTFNEYLFGTDQSEGMWSFALKAIVVLAVAAVLIRLLVNMLRLGPGRGVSEVGSEIKGAGRDVAGFSFRRVFGLARLAWREAMRKHVWIVFVVFCVILAVTVLLSGDGGSTSTENPAKLLITFVMSASAYLALFLGLFLSTFSIPNDVKQRTIYTVATKPVRAGEIVLGRIIGFAAFGTVMLAMMGVVSYLFVGRAVDHTHEIDSADLSSFETASGIGQRGLTSRELKGGTELENGHRHTVTLNSTGQGVTDVVRGHRHYVTRNEDGTYTVGPPDGSLAARVPVYGQLRFKDRHGADKDRGISVGSEWTYRSFITGGTLAAAIWKFDDVTRDRFPERVQLDIMLRAFRTYMGNIERGVEASVSLVNPTTGVKTAEQRFPVKEFTFNPLIISESLEDDSGKPLDLFEDLVDENGSLEVWIRCVDNEQYLGMAQADAYLRAQDASYTWNFIKGYLGIWMQMLTVISFGVMFSTLLSGPVAMMATLACLMLAMGDVRGQIEGIKIGMDNEISRDAIKAGGSKDDYPIKKGEIRGGGPVESFIRIVRQQNL